MSTPQEHFDALKEIFEDAEKEIKCMHADGHFVNKLIGRGVSHLLLMVKKLKEVIEQELQDKTRNHTNL